MTNQTNGLDRIDITAFDEQNTDQHKIVAGLLWVPCRICEAALGKLTLTGRYCYDCHRGMCEVHGNFAIGKKGTCVICGRQWG